ncbi:hypothetical protein ACA910_001559 [Epithemia clementina (nom. ined.)]
MTATLAEMPQENGHNHNSNADTTDQGSDSNNNNNVNPKSMTQPQSFFSSSTSQSSESSSTTSTSSIPDMVQLHDKTFVPYISEAAIQTRVAELGHALSKQYGDDSPIFVVMLKGAVVFATDLMRQFGGRNCHVCFLQTQSYRGTESTRQVQLLLSPPAGELTNRTVILVEDIVDTGHTMHFILPLLRAQQPKQLVLVTLLSKPDMLEQPLDQPLDYVGFTIQPPKFVVGYGLDYNGLGRNLRSIYVLKEQQEQYDTNGKNGNMEKDE